MSYCFVAEGVTQTAMQHLDETEDIEVHLFTEQEVRQMLADGVIKQSLMAAPLWRYFAEK